MQNDVEYDSFDVGKIYELIWDNTGNLQIVTPNHVIFTQQKCRIKAFDIKVSDLEDHNKEKFQDEDEFLGIRFDGKNHNWLIIGEYLQLPFSYMTFVIKDRIE
jgi:hypothetical protein